MKANYIIKHLSGTLIFFLILFVSAGTLNYWQAWVYAAIGLVMGAMHYTVLKMDSDLLEERATAGSDTTKWDKRILGLTFLMSLAMYVTAGLDSGRFHWSPDLHWSLYAIGILLTIVGQLLFLIAQKQNKFFSSTVRIQKDRGQTVCNTGLYRFVRHPGYLGSILQSLGFPLIMGSLWSIIPISLLTILFLIRTHLEDKTLKEGLKGYLDYTHNVRYRIIPYVW